MAKVINHLPEIEGEELAYVQQILEPMDDAQASSFATVYRERRKDPQTILILSLLGFIGIAGIQRFVLDQVGMGLLYLLTGGICLIGTIVDVVSYKRLTFEHNQRRAREVATLMK
ncbi:MAG: NINE protein [Candidatus Eisenbacteria bacterium]|nr:NINE protein [Candidatus Eisenbacteria bacterium]